MRSKLFLCVSLLLFCGCGTRESNSTAEAHWQRFINASPVIDPIHTPEWKEETILLPLNSVGSASCVECHAEQTEAYQQTSHSKSAMWVQEAEMRPSGEFEVGQRRFLAKAESGKLVHAEITKIGERLVSTDQVDAIFEIGSGIHARSYLTRRDGFWVQSPLTWYADPNQWELSPGYDAESHGTFDRAISTKCVFCHVGQIRTRKKEIHQFSIAEAAIGCERCHGSGEAHVAIQNRSAESISEKTTERLRDEIVHPAKLSREQQEAICSQCHLQGILAVSDPEFDRWDFKPGQRLADSITDFQPVGTETEFKIVGHTEQLHESRCYIESETLTCTTCHDPHASSQSTLETYRQSCLECHHSVVGPSESSKTACTAPIESRKQYQDACNRCHMPKRPTNVTHAALHDHRIGMHEQSFQLAGLDHDAKPHANKRTVATLSPISDVDRLSQVDHDRRWSLAMHAYAFRGGMPKEMLPEFDRARRLLVDLFRGGVKDPSVKVALARDYFDAKSVATSSQLARSVVAETPIGDPTRVIATDLLGQMALLRGDNEEALRWYRELTRSRRVSGDAFLLGVCELNGGNTKEAIAAFEMALRIDPTLLPAHEDLARFLFSQRQEERARVHQQMADLLRSNQEPAR